MRLFSLSLLMLLLATPLFAGESRPSKPVVSPATLEAWLSHLASDELAGRKVGTTGGDKARSWLAERFREAGLKTAPGLEDYTQPFSFTWKDETIEAANVIGYIEGADPERKHEHIIIGAHFDHIGKAEGDKIVDGDDVYNGADDNASGTIMTLAIAKTLLERMEAGEIERPARSLLFVAWDAEELGLFGSRHYVGDPVLPLEDMVVNINFEMVGVTIKNEPFRLWVTGESYSDFQSHLKAFAAPHGWTVLDDPFPDLNLFLRSDNAPFATLESEGEGDARTYRGHVAHSLSVWMMDDHYHQLHDEAHRVNYDNMANMASMLAAYVQRLAQGDEQFQWKPSAPFSRPEPKAAAEERPAP